MKLLSHKLSTISDYDAYIKEFQKNHRNCLKIIAIKGPSGSFLESSLLNLTKKIEITKENCVLIVLDGKIIEERYSYNPITVKTIIKGHLVEVLTTGDQDYCHIIIDGCDYCINSKGINIVLYNYKKQLVQDSICFNTTLNNCPGTRSFTQPTNELSLKQIANIVDKQGILIDSLTNKVFGGTGDDAKREMFRWIPQAEGNLRIIQLAATSLYKRLIEVCKTNNIKMCAMSGTMIGAIRHGGFIPWDDDIDVMMEKREFDKLYKALKDNTEIEIVAGMVEKRLLYKVVFKNYDRPFIDIFLTEYSKSDTKIAKKERKEAYKEFYKTYKTIFKSKTYFRFDSTFKDRIDSITDNSKKSYFTNDVDLAKSVCFCSNHVQSQKYIFKKEDIFPYEKATFEGLDIYIPHNPDNYCMVIYNSQVFTLPNDRHNHVQLSEKNVKMCKEILEKFPL